MLLLLSIASVLASLAWLYVYPTMLRSVRGTSMLRDLKPPSPSTWPPLSVIVPACNEADTLEAALFTLLQQDYPGLEIVLIDDRSTDGTGPLIDRMAASDPRIHPVHIVTLPEGWLGKVHAIHQGAKAARGEFLLFTDADVHFHGQVLRHAISLAVADGIDHLAVLPRVLANSVLLDAVLGAFGASLFSATRPDLIGKEGEDRYIGIGAFNLVRRSALEKSKGMEFIKMEVADDYGLGYTLHQAGARPRAVLGEGLLSIEWYRSVTEMIRGLEKNIFGVLARYNYLRLVITLGGTMLFTLGPFIAMLPLGVPYSSIAGAVAIVVWLKSGLAVQDHLDRRRLAVPLMPIAMVILAVTCIRSAWYCWRQGGIVWRGTLYPIALLKAGRRVEL